MTNVLEEIRSANRTFMEDFRRGDAAALAALYTPDAKLLPPDNHMMNGTEAIRSFWQGAMDAGFKEARLDTIEVDARDNLAYEVGHYALRMQPKSGGESTVEGKYVVVWKNRGGHWQLYADIWNGLGS